jgi:hypothetical protein
MYEALMRLEEPYQLAVNEEDMEKCLNYCRQVITCRKGLNAQKGGHLWGGKL